MQPIPLANSIVLVPYGPQNVFSMLTFLSTRSHYELRNLTDYREKSLVENFPLILILSPCVCARPSSVRNCHPLFQLPR